MPADSRGTPAAFKDVSGRVRRCPGAGRDVPVEPLPLRARIERGLAATLADYRRRGVAMVAIGSNDTSRYSEDGPGHLAEQSERAGFEFPYLVDESQEVAKAYRAACIPDLFVFDAARKLAYRGEFDATHPSNKLPGRRDPARGAGPGARRPAGRRATAPKHGLWYQMGTGQRTRLTTAPTVNQRGPALTQLAASRRPGQLVRHILAQDDHHCRDRNDQGERPQPRWRCARVDPRSGPRAGYGRSS